MTHINEHMKIHSLDYLRGIAIVAVVGVHVVGNFERMSTFGNLYLFNAVIHSVLLGIAVPLFLVVSGAALSSNYSGCFDVKSFYKKRLKTLLVPYLLGSLFYIAIAGYLHGWPTLSEIAMKLFTAEATTHFWYFRLIVELYLIYPLFIWIYESFEEYGIEWLFLFMLLLSQFTTHIILQEFSSPSLDRIFTFSQFWFHFGVGVYAGRKNLFRSWNPKGTFISKLGRESFGIYIIHVFFLGLSVRVLDTFGITRDEAIFYPASFLITIIPSYFVSKFNIESAKEFIMMRLRVSMVASED